MVGFALTKGNVTSPAGTTAAALDRLMNPNDGLSELMREAVAPASWEWEGAEVLSWGDLLIVAQTEGVHAEIEEFFAVFTSPLNFFAVDQNRPIGTVA